MQKTMILLYIITKINSQYKNIGGDPMDALLIKGAICFFFGIFLKIILLPIYESLSHTISKDTEFYKNK